MNKNENLDKPIKESFIFKDKMIRKINMGGSKNEAHNEIKRGSIWKNEEWNQNNWI